MLGLAGPRLKRGGHELTEEKQRGGGAAARVDRISTGGGEVEDGRGPAAGYISGRSPWSRV